MQVGVCSWFMYYIPLRMGRRRYFTSKCFLRLSVYSVLPGNLLNQTAALYSILMHNVLYSSAFGECLP